MNSQNSDTQSENGKSSDDEIPSSDRRAALTKLAYSSPAIAALLLSKSAAAQGSPCGPRGIFDPPNPPSCP